MPNLIESLENRRLMSVASISSIQLYNADTNQPISGYAPITSGSTIDLAKLPTRHVNILAKTSTTTGSVKFGLDSSSSYHVETYSPYFIGGDTNSKANSWSLTTGSHTLVVTAYSGASATGTAGTASTVKFTVTDSSIVANPAPAPVGSGVTRIVDINKSAGSYSTVASALSVANPGDVILIKPGTYHESIKFTRSGTSSAPITIYAATTGTVTIDGTGYAYQLDGSGAAYINLQNITFDHTTSGLMTAGVRIGNHWNVTDVTVQHAMSQGMVVYGTGTTLTRVIAQYNGQEGISGSNCSYITLKDCVTRYNNPGMTSPQWAGQSGTSQVNGLWYVNADYQSGAGKWVGTDHVTFDGVQSYSNHGTGIWFDGPNANVVIKNCNVHDAIPIKAFYEGVGISIEMNNTGAVTIENNTLSNNPGGSIVIASSKHVTVQYNNITGSYIALNDWPRGDAFWMNDITFMHNIMNNTFIWTGGDNWLATSGVDKDIVFDYDTYKGMTGPIAKWGTGTYTTITDVRNGLKLEAHGTQV